MGGEIGGTDPRKDNREGKKRSQSRNGHGPPRRSVRDVEESPNEQHHRGDQQCEWSEHSDNAGERSHRSNPRGAHRELWNHAQGCRRWFGVERDTVTYRISGSYRLPDGPHGRKD